MVIALIAVISMAVLGQFLLFYWRATMAVAAALPVSDRLRQAAGIKDQLISAADFDAVIRLHEVCPELDGRSASLAGIKLYHMVVRGVGQLFGPAMTSWVDQEAAICARYLAARLDQRISVNGALWTQARSSS
jgi:hypothetical protein